MLIKLSVRNAGRQLCEYALFFITLTCTAAAMYAFHALLFSDTVKALPDLELLPYLIVSASLLIVLIMGWIVRYMIHFMLKKRSREFGVYLLSGIPNRQVRALLLYENSLIGLLALAPGILLGLLFSQILEAVLLHLFGLPYALHFRVSPPAAGLTLLYFAAMLWHSARKNGKWLRRVPLRELLDYDRQNEAAPVSGSRAAVLRFGLSVPAGCAGLLFLSVQPVGKGYDVLLGTALLLLFLRGFFGSVPAFLAARFGDRTDWKYRRHRLTLFRGFTAKIHSTSTVLGVLSILFLLSIALGGVASTIGLMVTENVKAGAFDVLILNKGALGDFSPYAAMLAREFSARGHAYAIRTGGKTDFVELHNRAVTDAGRPPALVYAEFERDCCMAQSDYQTLRELLGYPGRTLDPSRCYVHCVPALEKYVRAQIGLQTEYAGYPFAADGVFTEPFSQINSYGNGMGFVVIVPDRAAAQMEVVYSVYAAVTENPLTPGDLQSVEAAGSGLALLDRSSAASTPDGAPTTLRHEELYYLSGKWMDKAGYHYLYAMLICLLYLAVILEITGAAILATQVLSDWQAKQRQDRILRLLGMEARLAARLNRRRLAQLFLFPLLPALPLSVCFVSICAKKILAGFFPLPPVPDSLWIARSLAIALALFSALYGVYYAAARILDDRRGI